MENILYRLVIHIVFFIILPQIQVWKFFALYVCKLVVSLGVFTDLWPFLLSEYKRSRLPTPALADFVH